MSTKTKSKKEVKGEIFLRLDNSRILKHIIDALSGIIGEAEFLITPEKLQLKAMDPSRICLLQLEMKDDTFENFTCNKDCKIGINTEDLDKILKRCGTNESIEISFKDNEQKIRIKFCKEDSKRSRNFSLSLLDIQAEEIPLENLLQIAFESIFVLEPSLLLEAIKDAEIYSEILNIKCSEELLKMTSSGQIGEMEYELDKEECIEFESGETEASGSYAIRFLKNIMKVIGITEKLEISLKTDHPLKFAFDLLEGAQLTYFLAPRVEEADFDEEELEEMDEF